MGVRRGRARIADMLPSLSAAAAASLLALAALVDVAGAQSAVALTLPAKRAAATVSDYLSPSFAGFGIEASNLFAYTGYDNPNTFSVQLLQNLADYAGAPPHLRIGGNTQDYMYYNESYMDWNWMANPNAVGEGVIKSDSMIIGPRFFQALDRFPKGSWTTVGLNIAWTGSDYITRITNTARAAVSLLKNVQLYSFEIGNEPDLYGKNGFRDAANWTGAVYTSQFMDRADAVYNQVLKPAGLSATFFEPPATASTIDTTFDIATLVKDGLLNDKNGNYYVGWWNQHDYFQFIGVTTEPITLDNLMDFDSTNAQFNYWSQQVSVALGTGVPYVLREMSSVGPIGMYGVSDTFGAALWTLNFFCYTATLNISSVQMHMTDNSNASAWQPTTVYGKAPFVRPQYYAHAAVAQIIGNGNGTTQIGSLNTGNIGGTYKGRIRAYSVYANGAVQAAVLINGKPSNTGSFSFTLTLGTENANRNVYLSYLTADNFDSQSGTVWNGMTYSDTDGKSTVVDSSVKVQRTDSSGSVTVQIRDSQAVVVNLDWQLGTNAVLKTDGTTTAGSRRKNSAAPGLSGGRPAALWAAALAAVFFCLA